MCINPNLVWGVLGLLALGIPIYGIATCSIDWIKSRRQVAEWRSDEMG